MGTRNPFWGAGKVSHHQQLASIDRGSNADLPVRPQCDNIPVDVFPNEVYDGAVDPEGAAPDEPEDAEAEEAVPRASIAPISPTAAERSNHRLSRRAQFRSWCAHCLRIRGRENQHGRTNNGAKAFPILHWDYGYLSSKDEEGDRLAEENRESPLLVMRDSTS